MPAGPILLIDNLFPQPRKDGFSGRRHAEFVAFLDLLPNAISVCPPQAFTRRRDEAAFASDRSLLLGAYPQLEERRITYCADMNALVGDLAYCVFPGYAFRLLPWLERRGIRFCFTIYPGGGLLMWGKGKAESDQRLAALFGSPFFAGVFVHHAIIRRYLEETFSVGDKMHFWQGGFSQLDEGLIQPKTHFGFERQTMNICFVANRYDPQGIGKGYDVFIETAKRLAGLHADCMFHVVGDWDADIFELGKARDRVRFHGYLSAPALAALYADMDAIVSPTRIDVPVEGKFDGFPLAVDAGLCGVAMFVTDPLGQNEEFAAGKELEVITTDPDDIVARLLKYFDEPGKLRQMGLRGQERLRVARNKEQKLHEKAAVLARLAESAQSR